MIRIAFTLWVVFASASTHATEAPDVEIARRHFRRGAELYDAQRYDEAIDEMERARSVRDVPELDFNIARCHDRLEHLDLAIANYERYLASHPSDERDVRARVIVLRARLSAKRARYSVAVPAAFGAVAVASLVVGGALYAVSGAQYDSLGSCRGTQCPPGKVDSTYVMDRTSVGFFIAGGVLAAVDIGLWAAWRRHR